jgi:hypothetical protein
MVDCKWPGTARVLVSLLALATAAGCQLSVGESESGDGGEGSEDFREPSPGERVGETNPGGGTPSAAGGADSSASGGTASAAGGAESSASGGTAGAVSGGANGTPSAGRGGGASGAPNTPNTPDGAAHSELCGVEETVQNGDRDQAQPLGTEASFCVDEDDDHDWFYVDVPDDGKAHVIELELTPEPAAWVNAEVYAAADFSKIGAMTIDEGTKTSAFVTVGPGTRTLFDFSEYAKSEGLTVVRTTVTAEKDPHERNNERDAAATITAGSEVRAQLMVPYTTDADRSSEDWYALDLGAGAHTVRVSAVAQEVYLSIDVLDGSGVAVDSADAPNRGAIFDFDFEAKTAGTFFFRFRAHAGELPAIGSGKLPKFLGDEYVFTID